MSVTSLRITSMFGWAWIVSVTARGKSSRATPRAPPAGTGLASAQRRITDPRRLSSSLSSPEAVSRARFPSEFEHTSSAKCSVRWAGVSLRGRISHNSTEQPSSAACQAASLPASPAPMMVTFGIKEDPPLVALQGGYSTLRRCRHLFPSSSSNPPIRLYGSGGRAALPQSIQQRISSQPFVHARFAHSFGLHATFLPVKSRNRPSARADYARTRRLRPSVTSRDSSAKRSRFVGELRALYPPRPA